MIVFECLVNKDMNPRQLRSEAMEIITREEKDNEHIISKMNSSVSSSKSADIENPELAAQQWCEALARVTGSVELNLLLQSGVFFGLVTDLKYGQDKARRFLSDLHDEMVKLYKGNINFIHRQQNLKPNVYDKVFKAQFQRVLDNNATGIKSNNLNAAIAKADEVKVIAARSVQKMNENMAETQKLL